jgi:hypothetical protein
VGAGLVAVRMRLEGAPESLYCVGRSCISWQLVRKRLATLKKYSKEQQDSFSIITQTEHLTVLLKWYNPPGEVVRDGDT